jgi:hypothetical protein
MGRGDSGRKVPLIATILSRPAVQPSRIRGGLYGHRLRCRALPRSIHSAGCGLAHGSTRGGRALPNKSAPTTCAAEAMPSPADPTNIGRAKALFA